MQLTQREFLFLEDILHAEQLEISKFQDFAAHCQDPQLSNLCLQIANRHKTHFNRLMGILNQSGGSDQANAYSSGFSSPTGYHQ
jgi:hypothetical protein